MAQFSIERPTPSDLNSIKAVIEATGLFPPAMLDGMILPFFDSKDNLDECLDLWFIEKSSSGNQDAVDCAITTAVVYCGPERLTEGTYNVWMLAVDPSFQRQRCGTRLMMHLEQHLQTKRKARLLLVETSGLDEFGGTRRFYEANGFTEEARIREFYQKGEDKIVYSKKLNSTTRADLQD